MEIHCSKQRPSESDRSTDRKPTGLKEDLQFYSFTVSNSIHASERGLFHGMVTLSLDLLMCPKLMEVDATTEVILHEKHLTKTHINHFTHCHIEELNAGTCSDESISHSEKS